MGGKNIPLMQHQVIFDCLASYKDYQSLKRAMLSARPDAPAHTCIRLYYCHHITTALIRVDPLDPFDPNYLLGGWQIPDDLIPLPYYRVGLC